MRSGDGDSTKSLRIFFILTLFVQLFFSTANADEYYVSYRYVVKDAMMFNESLHVSKAMKQCGGKSAISIELESHESRDLKRVIKENFEDFFLFISKLGFHIQDSHENYNAQAHNMTTTTLKSQCFKVHFNDNFATITALK